MSFLNYLQPKCMNTLATSHLPFSLLEQDRALFAVSAREGDLGYCQYQSPPNRPVLSGLATAIILPSASCLGSYVGIREERNNCIRDDLFNVSDTKLSVDTTGNGKILMSELNLLRTNNDRCYSPRASTKSFTPGPFRLCLVLPASLNNVC